MFKILLKLLVQIVTLSLLIPCIVQKCISYIVALSPFITLIHNWLWHQSYLSSISNNCNPFAALSKLKAWWTLCVALSVKLWPQKTCNVLSADQDMLIILFASSSNTQFWPKLQASKVESQNILTRLEKGAMVVFIHFYLHFQKLVLLFSVWLSRGHHAVTAVQWQLHVHVSAYFYKIGFL